VFFDRRDAPKRMIDLFAGAGVVLAFLREVVEVPAERLQLVFDARSCSDTPAMSLLSSFRTRAISPLASVRSGSGCATAPQPTEIVIAGCARHTVRALAATHGEVISAVRPNDAWGRRSGLPHLEG
jgi:hypothetical protein